MSAREWLRRRLAGRSLQLLAGEVEFQLEKAADRELVIANYAVQLAAERERADDLVQQLNAMGRERDAWRVRARSVPLTVVEDTARLARVEQTGGR